MSLTNDQREEMCRTVADVLWLRMSDVLERKVYASEDAPTRMSYLAHGRQVEQAIAPLIESWQDELLAKLTAPATAHAAAAARMAQPTDWWVKVAEQILTAAVAHVRGAE